MSIKEIEQMKQEIMYKVINRKQKYKNIPFKYTGEDVLFAIDETYKQAKSEMNLKVKELKKSFDKDRYSKEIVLMIIDKVFGEDLIKDVNEGLRTLSKELLPQKEKENGM